MKNLLIAGELIHAFTELADALGETSVAAVCYNLVQSELLLLSGNGILIRCHIDDKITNLGQEIRLNDHLLTEDEEGGASEHNEQDNSWFHISFISETSSIVCISHRGNIVRVHRNGEVDHEGCVDGGIGCAGWSPDQTNLILVSRNNTILSMSNCFDLTQEIPVPAITPGTVMSMSWCENGELFSVSTSDADDGVNRIRVYNKDLELVSTVRNIADGPALIVKGINSSSVAFANNGSLIAFPLERVKGKHQVAFCEKNGLRHGEFDLHLPYSSDWEVTSVHWDLTTTFLAVGFKDIRIFEKSKHNSCFVHIYYRGNYHWYLKQQFSGTGLRCLGFDSDTSNRLYLTQPSSFETGRTCPAIRVIDIAWDVTRSVTAESSVAVVDGCRILLTPLGICNIPPPMSSFQASLPHPCIDSCFFSTKPSLQDESFVWGLLCLCDSDMLSIIFGDKRGSPAQQVNINLASALSKFRDANQAPLLSADCSLVLRGVTVMECCSNADVVRCVLVGYSLSSAQASLNECDVMLIMDVDWRNSTIISINFKYGFDGAITRITEFDESSVVVGVNTMSSFQLQTVAVPNGCEEDVSIVDVIDAVDTPERSNHISVIHSKVAHIDHKFAIVALSNRNRLYCGNTLIASGVVTFAVNSSLDMLLFITQGTKPHLHFLSCKALVEAFHNDAAVDDAGATMLECAEPRPVERGARLVATVCGDAKVIIQLPRGNLETFEPRPLVLMQARKLLDNDQLFECVLLLRRQKVDINYVIDYSSELFLKNVPVFVREALAKNSDILSLLISSLEPNRNSVLKYQIRNQFDATAQLQIQLTGNDKINCVCSAIRTELLSILSSGTNFLALNPILCTFAKQRPPLLSEALKLVSDVFCSSSHRNDSSASVSALPVRATVLATAKVQSALKYLLFLAEGIEVFNAALGDCDFEMSRAVARQCQMDPKVYLPLIEGFQSIGRGTEEGSFEHSAMRFRIFKHLKNHIKVVEWGVRTLKLADMRSVETASPSTEGRDASLSLASISNDLFVVVKENEVYASAISLLNSCVLVANSNGYSGHCGQLLRKLRSAFGSHLLSKHQYQESAMAYLAAIPPFFAEAIESARRGGDWMTALTISGRYVSPMLAFSESIPAEYARIAPKQLAYDITSTFQESLEQGAYDDEGAASSSADAEIYSKSSTADRAVEAAQIRLDFCEDVHGAVSILVLAHKWREAVAMATKTKQHNLLTTEIAPAIRDRCIELIRLMKTKSKKQITVLEKLRELWIDPIARLKAVVEVEPELLNSLKGIGLKGELDGAEGAEQVGDDNKSEYSSYSNMSSASYLSTNSAATSKSGTTTVTVLSSLTIGSETQRSQASSSKEKSFSIEGLEHTLLSRGVVDESKGGKGKKPKPSRQHSEKQQKKRDRRQRGTGPDVCGLKLECQLCSDMWELALSLKGFAVEAAELCEVLTMIGGFGKFDGIDEKLIADSHLSTIHEEVTLSNLCGSDVSLASLLQKTVDQYAVHFRNNSSPIGPCYSTAWLDKKCMAVMSRFQDRSQYLLQASAVTGLSLDELSVAHANAKVKLQQQGVVSPNEGKNWWELVADGITAWQKLRKLNLALENC